MSQRVPQRARQRKWRVIACLLLCLPAVVRADAVAPATARNDLVVAFRAAFAQGDGTTATRLAREILALDEQSRGPNDPSLVPDLLNVASAEAELGNTEQAEVAISRATALLAAQPAPNPAHTFARDIVLAKSYLQAGRNADAERECRQALKSAEGSTAVSIAQRSEAYSLLLKTQVGQRNFPKGNAIARDMLRAEREAYGSESPARVPGLYEAARWYRQSSQLPSEREVLAEALVLLEKAYGPDDPRLAYPLWTTGVSYLVGQNSQDEALSSLKRANALPLGVGPGALVEHAQIVASLGDYSIVFGDPAASGEHYSAAWKLIALSPELGAAVANQIFSRPVPLNVSMSDTPFRAVDVKRPGRGEITLGFTITAQGLVEDLRILDQQMDSSLLAPAVQAFRRARYRPRIVDGQPLATPEQQFKLQFSVQ